MKKILFTIVCTLPILTFSACSGVDDGACCDAMVTLKKDIILKEPDPALTPKAIPNEDDEDNKTEEPTTLPPVAVITPDVQSIKERQPTTFNCAKSYDQDEQGEKIVECIWTFKCYENGKFKCKCKDQKGGVKDGVTVTPPYAKWVDYLEVTLTVVDDENQTDTVIQRYNIVE